MSKKDLSCFKLTKKWFWVERGDIKLNKQVITILNRFLNKKGYEIEVVDRRVYFKLPEKYQINMLWDKLTEPKKSLQKTACKEWLENKYGQLIAAPRFGKTVVGSILASKSKTRVAIIIHQKELLDQFYNTFMKFTDIQERQKFLGRTLIKINPKVEEVDKLTICLFTWQQFINKKRLKSMLSKFGFILFDESHFTAAKTYSDRISRFKAKYRCGVTATPKRRDGYEYRVDRIIGPPTVYGGEEQLKCKFSVVSTDVPFPVYENMNNRHWNYLWGYITKSKARNEIIAKYVKRDLKHEHKIVVPVKRVAHLEILKKCIVKECGKDIKIALFHGGSPDRKRMAERIRAGYYDVVLATTKMISVGFDAPPISCLHVVMPIFNNHNFYQQYSRIRTMCEGKQTPLIRLYIDDSKISESFKRMALKEMHDKDFKDVTKATKRFL